MREPLLYVSNRAAPRKGVVCLVAGMPEPPHPCPRRGTVGGTKPTYVTDMRLSAKHGHKRIWLNQKFSDRASLIE